MCRLTKHREVRHESRVLGAGSEGMPLAKTGTEEEERVCMGKVMSFGVAEVKTVGRHCTWESRAQEEGWGKGTDFGVIST